jgi:hypothetical protein
LTLSKVQAGVQTDAKRELNTLKLEMTSGKVCTSLIPFSSSYSGVNHQKKRKLLDSSLDNKDWLIKRANILVIVDIGIEDYGQ